MGIRSVSKETGRDPRTLSGGGGGHEIWNSCISNRWKGYGCHRLQVNLVFPSQSIRCLCLQGLNIPELEDIDDAESTHTTLQDAEPVRRTWSDRVDEVCNTDESHGGSSMGNTFVFASGPGGKVNQSPRKGWAGRSCDE